LQRAVSGGDLSGVQDSQRASSQQGGPVAGEARGDPVETPDELVVQPNQDVTASHLPNGKTLRGGEP